MVNPVRRRGWKIAGLVVAGLLIVLGWTQRHRFTPLGVGSPAPEYATRTLSGEEVSLADYRGKVVLLNVWATWCPPCIREMPSMERAYQQLKDEGFEVLAVSVDAPIGTPDILGNPGGDVKAFVTEFRLTFPILLDPEKRIEKKFSTIGLPTTFILDRSGRIARIELGGKQWDSAENIAFLRSLLDKAE